MITPTIGRVVWFREGGSDQAAQPQAALVTYVHSDTMVNLAVFDPNGFNYSKTSVTLVQEGHPVPPWAYCEWMPYQKGQAAKFDAAKFEALKAEIGKGDA